MDVQCPQCEGHFTPSKEGEPCPHCGAPSQEPQAGFSLMETLDPAHIPSGSYNGFEDASATSPAADADELIGLQLGNFVLREKIGEGGFGVVYRAEQVFLKQPFAIKILHLNKRAAPELIERFRREALAIARLRHPNAVQLSDFGLLPEERGFYLVMELLEGMTLLDALATDEPFPPDRIANVVTQLCEVLYEAHELGIYHRDLKPANVFLQPHRRGHDVVKLLDFGVATMLEEKVTLTQTAAILGSPAYMSPEQSQGNAAQLDGRSDLYSMGVMLFEMLTRRLPFEADTLTAMLFQHAFEAPPSLAAAAPAQPWSPALEAFVSKALAKSPEERPQDADAFAHECQEALDAQAHELASPSTPSAATPTPDQRAADPSDTIPAPVAVADLLPQSQTRQQPSRRLWPVLALVPLLALLGGAGWWLLPRGSRQASNASLARRQPAKRPPTPPMGRPPQAPHHAAPARSLAMQRKASLPATVRQPPRPRKRRVAHRKRRRSHSRRRTQRHPRRRAIRRRRTGAIPARLREHVAALQSRNPATRRAAGNAICSDPDGVAVMMHLMKHSNGYAKTQAVSCFEMKRAYQAIPLMIQWLSLPRLSGTNIMRIEQAFSRMGGAGIRRLAKAYKRYSHPDAQRNVLRVLLHIGYRNKRPVLALFPSLSDDHKIFAMRMLMRWKKKTPQARQLLVKLVDHPNPVVRRKLPDALGLFPCCPKQLLPVMLKLLDDRDRQTRYNAMRRIAAFRKASQIKQALPLLLASLRRGPQSNRNIAIRQLVLIDKDNPKVLAGLGAIFKTSYACKIQRAALLRLAHIARGNPAALPHIETASRASRCPDVRKYAQSSLVRLRGQ